MTPATPAPLVTRTMTPPRLDGDGGAVLVVPDGVERLRVISPAARHLDVIAPASLREIDLTACPPDVALSLEAVGPFEGVMFRGEDDLRGSGASLTLRLSLPREHHLRVEGLLRHLNLAWVLPGGDERWVQWTRRGGRPLRGLWLSRAEVRPAGARAWIAHEGALAADERFEDLSHLWLLGVRTVGDTLRLRGLRDVTVQSSDVGVVDAAGVERLALRGCHALRRVTGEVGRLLLRGSARGPVLELDGAIGHADLIDVACAELRLRGCADVRLANCHAIQQLRALGADAVRVATQGGSPQLNGDIFHEILPPNPREIEEQFAEGTLEGRRAMVAWARGYRGTAALESALRVLGAAVDTELHTPLEAWRFRCELHDHHLRRPETPRGGARVDQGEWCWGFAEDQALRGYETDLFLWLRLLGDDEATAMVEARSFLHTGSPANVGALLVTATHPDLHPDERPVLLELARAALEQGATLGRRLDRERRPGAKPPSPSSGEVSATHATWVHLALHGLEELAREPGSREVAEAMTRWLAARAPTELGVRALGRLAVHGLEAATRCIADLRRGLDHRGDLTPEGRAALARAVAEQSLLPRESTPFRPR